jgi:hypothetical protein
MKRGIVSYIAAGYRMLRVDAELVRRDPAATVAQVVGRPSKVLTST